MPLASEGRVAALHPQLAGGTFPAAITDFTVTVVSTTRIDLACGVSQGATSYVWQYSLDGISFADVPGSPTADPSLSVTGLSPGTRYYFNVRGLRGTLFGAPSADVAKWTLPAQVLNLQAMAASASEIDTAWSSVTGALLYQVWRSRDGGLTYGLAPVATPSSNSFTNSTGLLPGTTYTYKVLAVNADLAVGAFSVPASATTEAGSQTLLPDLQIAADLEEAAGTRANAVVGGPAGTPHGDTLPGNMVGLVGSALSLVAAQHQYVEYADGPATRFVGNQWLIGFLYRPTSVAAGTEMLVGKYNDAGSQGELYIERSAATISVAFGDGVNQVAATSNQNELRVNQWNFVLAWFDGVTLYVAVNRFTAGRSGALGSKVPVVRNVPLRIGRMGASYTNGGIDSLFLWVGRPLANYERLFLVGGFRGRSAAEVLAASPTPPSPSAGPALIWDAQAWNGNPDVVFWEKDNAYWAVFRCSTNHNYDANSFLRLMRCPAGAAFTNPASWTSMATLTSPDPGRLDVRDAAIGVTPDGQGLFTHTSCVDSGENLNRVSYIWFSVDGVAWTPQAMAGIVAGDWPWRVRVFPDGNYYTVTYLNGVNRLCRSPDGVAWTVIVDPLFSDANVNEADLLARRSDEAGVCLIRHDTSSTTVMGGPAPPPYTSGWGLRDTIAGPGGVASSSDIVGVTGSNPNSDSSLINGPRLFEDSNGRLIAVGRAKVANQRAAAFIASVELDQLEEWIHFDNNLSEAGYAGAVEKDGYYRILFYDNASGKPAIYAVEVPVLP